MSSHYSKLNLSPERELVKEIVVPIISKCEAACACRSQTVKTWIHQPCGSTIYANNYGDIFCKHYLDKSECTVFSLKNADFKCGIINKLETPFKISQFLMSFALVINAAKNFLNDENQLLSFIEKFTAETMRKWSE